MSRQINRPARLEALYPGDTLGPAVADLVVEYTLTGYECFNGVTAWVCAELNKGCGRGHRARADFAAFVQQEVRVAWNHLAAEQRAAWPPVTDVERLREAFKTLDSQGIMTAEDLGGGLADFMDIIRRTAARSFPPFGFTFFSGAGTGDAIRGCGLPLTFGSVSGLREDTVAVGNHVVQELQAVGLTAERRGDAVDWIRVPMVWQNRLPVLPPTDEVGGGPGTEERERKAAF